jgi:hypothetical protein
MWRLRAGSASDALIPFIVCLWNISGNPEAAARDLRSAGYLRSVRFSPVIEP